MPKLTKRIDKQQLKDDEFWNRFEKLCEIHCNIREICHILAVSSQSLDKRTMERYKLPLHEAMLKFQSYGTMGLRRKAWELANAGDVKMLVYLLNNYTEAKNNPETAITINNQAIQNNNSVNLITLTEEDKLRIAGILDQAGVLDKPPAFIGEAKKTSPLL